jgi:hypothetical protein
LGLKGELKKTACFEMNWLPTKVPNSIPKGTPPVNQNTNSVHEDTSSTSDYVNDRSDIIDELGRRLVVRNGVNEDQLREEASKPSQIRTIQTEIVA